MTHSYTAPWRKLALAAMLGLAGTTAAQAQALNYNLFGTSNSAGTYTDLGTSGTVITTPNNDDANSASTPIGFTFNFNGTAFTDFVLNTNGFLKLGTTAPAAPFFYTDPQAAAGGPLNTATETNLLLPLNLDLEGTATTEYRVATTGAAGSRVTTIQWKNVSDKLPAGKQFANISFQVKLYETSNRVEFVYGTATAGPGPDGFKAAAVGIKGSDNTATTSVLVTKGSVQAWGLASFVAGNYTGNAHNVRSSVLPDAGRTYTFNQAAANDAAVLSIYALGKTPSIAQTVQAVVRNTGASALTNVPVTLSVTGANTFTDAKIIPTLAVGASTVVTFTAFTPTTVGNNTLAVSVPADGSNNNNTQTYTQVVTAGTFSYANNTPFDPNLSVGFTATTTGAFVARFTTPTARTITAVAAGIADPNTVGRTVYSVVVDANGAVLGRSADYVVQTADINTLKTLPLQTAVATQAGGFYVGLVQTAAPAGGARYFPMATLPENPTRLATFFTIAPFAANGGTLVDAAPSNLGAFVLDAQTSIVQGTSEALNRAISMYPNPSTGLVKLDVRGANAKGNLQVSVVNMLGQTVHTAALKDNFTNEVNLSGLANGMYLLKVQTGADYTVRQLTITK
ncbi:T9SS type A sorting domain-containing protein [Hymenobacter yonginensis]|uniref:T9SS type A sorting domain-containing protein n=1 Tax=Hymenobacter yonginensis TaxID=748197 RepID=A0ABY7PPV8_9BACT|nr:T9SS type A sorting domain-containing protein [Hymenobacter yonginensis]WBO84652.1 T9SS type A sorting domain-containing protein [Hymenobacter yonginensis]